MRNGYKQTEVGVIPDDWSLKPLSNLTTLMTNGFVGIAKIHYTTSDNGVIYIQGYNVEENGFNFHGVKKVSLNFHKKNLKSCLREDDLLTVQTGDVGLTTIVPKHLENANCHALIISRFKKQNYAAKFFSYYLNSMTGRARLREIEVGTTMKHINVGNLIHFLVPLPPTLEEQHLIANALSDTDAWIQYLVKLIDKKRQIKKGAMQKLLSPWATENGELKIGELKAGYKQTEIGAMPEDWDLKPLSDLTILMTNGFVGIAKINYTDSDDGVTYIQGYNVQENGFNFNGIKKVSMNFHKKNMKSCLREGDLLTVQTGDVGLTTIIPKQLENANCHALIISRFIKQKYAAKFFSYYLNSSIGRSRLKEIEVGTTMKHINVGNLIHFIVPVPPLKEQQRIATILSDMDSEITLLENKLKKARQIKEGMMQDLLTGKVRLV